MVHDLHIPGLMSLSAAGLDDQTITAMLATATDYAADSGLVSGTASMHEAAAHHALHVAADSDVFASRDLVQTYGQVLQVRRAPRNYRRDFTITPVAPGAESFEFERYTTHGAFAPVGEGNDNWNVIGSGRVREQYRMHTFGACVVIPYGAEQARGFAGKSSKLADDMMMALAAGDELLDRISYQGYGTILDGAPTTRFGQTITPTISFGAATAATDIIDELVAIENQIAVNSKGADRPDTLLVSEALMGVLNRRASANYADTILTQFLTQSRYLNSPNQVRTAPRFDNLQGDGLEWGMFYRRTEGADGLAGGDGRELGLTHLLAQAPTPLAPVQLVGKRVIPVVLRTGGMVATYSGSVAFRVSV